MDKLFLVFSTLFCLSRAGLNGNKDCVLYLGFDRYIGSHILDNSMENNNATLNHGATVTKVEGSCGVCAQLLGGNINIQGKGFRGIPQSEVTIAFMIKLLRVNGLLHLFETIGGHSKHQKLQYRLEVQDGKLIWFHRNSLGNTLFSVATDEPVLTAGAWNHVLVTYTVVTGTAQVFINGALTKEVVKDPGVPLSTDWEKYVGIGSEEGEKDLRGYIDEFYIFNKTLKEMEIKNLMSKCSGAKSSVILHLAFEKDMGNVSLDTSGLKNDASIMGITPLMPSLAVNGTCGMGLKVPSNTGIIKLDGKTIRNKPTDAVTIALWANFTTVEGRHTLFETIGGHSMHSKNQYELSVNDGSVLWRHRNEYDQIVFEVKSGAMILPRNWVHFAATYSSTSSKAGIYINGVLVKEAPGTGSLSEDWDGQAGFGMHTGLAGDMLYIDEIMAYNRALTPFEVKNLFGKCNFGGNSGGSKGFQLVYYSFERQSGNIVFDDSGNSIDASVSSLAQVTKASGNCGSGLRLNQGDISIKGSAMIRRPLFGITVMLWLKLDNIQGDQEIFMTTNPKNPGNKHGQYHFQINAGSVRWFHRNTMSQTIFSVETKEAIIQPGVWTHVCATYDVRTRKAEIYINGQLKNSQTSLGGGALSQDWSGKVVIGKLYDMSDSGQWIESQPLLGIIDEFYIFGKALPAAEIQSLSQTCNSHRVVLHFGFEKGQGLFTLDQSGLGNNGKLVNLTLSDMPGICGLGMNMSHGEIDIDGQRFKGKPLNAITLATWMKLNTNRGHHQLFNTIGSRSEHKDDQYNFAIDNGKVIWSHNDEKGKSIFRIETIPIIPARNWTHVTATYDSTSMLAKVYTGGKLIKEKSGTGLLSQDWGHFAGIGRHFYEKEYLNGATDEFLMYNYALSDSEIQYLAKANCGK
ncbi:uncharacterized protein LOC114532854 [Dendronephthya gigantea]|uniref:uncharacterized protein LOC114532854 n=1 Tax=Dendronephthya gigantea TaxID=151771 RepID=UPI00106A8651|nr:uncharacterized protein LOC114532854 [Dendronephthya gigantea]XP_028410254.1 uncharacterized protein LOC114532854 [Dendronephthya gigantea]